MGLLFRFLQAVHLLIRYCECDHCIMHVCVFGHGSYLKSFRTEQCKDFLQHRCKQHRPYTCFHWHFPNQRRRRPIRKRDGSFNYSPNEYCAQYNESTGICPNGDRYARVLLFDNITDQCWLYTGLFVCIKYSHCNMGYDRRVLLFMKLFGDDECVAIWVIRQAKWLV